MGRQTGKSDDQCYELLKQEGVDVANGQVIGLEKYLYRFVN